MLRKKPWPFLLKLSLGLGLLGVVLYLVDYRELGETLIDLNPWYLLAAVVFINLDRWLMAYKWRPLLAVMNVHVPFFLLFRIYSASPLAGAFLPSSIGGDMFRIYCLSRYQVNARAVLGSIISERAIGTVATLTLASISLGLASYILKDQWDKIAHFGWVLAGGSAITLAVIGVLVVYRGKRIGKLADRWTPRPVLEKLHQFHSMLLEYRGHWPTLVFVLAWSLLEQLYPVGLAFLLSQALHIEVSLLELTAIMPIIALLSRIPIPFDGLGFQEGLYVGLLALVGISAAEALLLIIITRGMYLTCSLPWTLHFLLASQKRVLPQQPTSPTAPGESPLATTVH